MNTAAYEWHTFGNYQESDEARQYLARAEDLLGWIAHDPIANPDAWSFVDGPWSCKRAFRFDAGEGSPSAILTVEIDEDPPARAVRAEVRRV